MAKVMTIERSVSINKNISDVFDYLKETKHQDAFSVWNMKDPNSKKTYSGVDGTKGFVYTWDSKDKAVGAGSQEITNIAEGSRIDYELRFERPMKNIATSGFVLNKEGESSTNVTWSFVSESKFPMSLFAPIFKRMLGKQINQSLLNLKALLEKV